MTNSDSSSSLLTPAQIEQFIQQGYVKVSGLIPNSIVEKTRESLLRTFGIHPDDPTTWTGKPSVPDDPAIIALTVPCRTDAMERVAQEFVGPDIAPGLCRSPYLESKGAGPQPIRGFIPVLNYPTPGPRTFQRPGWGGYHIDGMHLTTLWPVWHYLILFAYLTDTPEFGGATTVLPGSHRQVFEYWHKSGLPGNTRPPSPDAIAYADPVPLSGKSGDVIFMHYLLVHSGSPNHADHIRVGLNSVVMPDQTHTYQSKPGPPKQDWTPLDWTLRHD
jgi:hypothetical protein